MESDGGAAGGSGNGTYDMMGNVWEWMEDSGGVVRGSGYNISSATFLSSSYRHLNFGPSDENYTIGFRVVAVPEPSTALLLAAGGCIAWLARLKQRL